MAHQTSNTQTSADVAVNAKALRKTINQPPRSTTSQGKQGAIGLDQQDQPSRGKKTGHKALNEGPDDSVEVDEEAVLEIQESTASKEVDLPSPQWLAQECDFSAHQDSQAKCHVDLVAQVTDILPAEPFVFLQQTSGPVNTLVNSGIGANQSAIPFVLGGATALTSLGGESRSYLANVLQGTIVAGPVTASNQLHVKVFNAAGQLIADTQVDARGQYKVSLGSYTGMVFVMVVDTDAGADYIDEVSRRPIDLRGHLLAVGFVVDGASTQTININPMTTVAALKAGLQPTDDGTGVMVGEVTKTRVDAANMAVAKALLGDATVNLLLDQVTPTVNVDGSTNLSANSYGKILAVLAGVDALLNGDSTQTLSLLVSGISDNGMLSANLKSLLNAGAIRSGVAVSDLPTPMATLTAGNSTNTVDAVVQSTKVGTAYLVKTGGTDAVTVVSLSDITTATDARWNNQIIAVAATDTNLSLSGLEDGTYSLYTADAEGNLSLAASNTYTIDNTAATVNSLEMSATGGQNNTLNIGDVVTLTVTFSEAVTVTGIPRLEVMVGSTSKQASYASGSGTNSLSFTYSIAAGDEDSNGIAVVANGLSLSSGTIEDAAGNTAVISHIALSDDPSYWVDGTAPTAALTAGNSANTGNALVQSSEAGTAYLVKTGGPGALTVNTLTNITTAADTRWNSQSIAVAATATNLSLSGLEDGTYSLYAADAAGNLSLAAGGTYTIDSTPPPEPVVSLVTDSGAADGITNVGTVSVSGVEANATWQYSTDSGSNWFTGSGAGFALGENIYTASTVRVKVTDTSGNSTTWQNATTITVDKTAPILTTFAQSTAYVLSTNTSLLLNSTKLGTASFDRDLSATGFSVSAWVNLVNHNSGAYQTIFGTPLNPAYSGFGSLLAFTGGTYALGQTNAIWVVGDQLSNVPVTFGTWQNVTITVSALGQETLYVNGTKVFTQNGVAIAGGNTTLYFGSPHSTYSPTALFKGSANLIKVYGYVLDQPTVQQQMLSNSPQDGDLLGFYSPNTASASLGVLTNQVSGGADMVLSSVRTEAASNYTGPTSKVLSYLDDQGSITALSNTAATTDDPTPGVNVGQNLSDTPSLYVNGQKVSATYDATAGTLTPVSALSGTVQLSYTLTDAAGNESDKSLVQSSLTIDSTPPALLTLVMPTSNAPSVPGGQKVSSVQGLEAGASWEYKIGSSGSWTPGGGSTFTLPSTYSGSDVVSVRQTDAAGNRGSERLSTDASGVINNLSALDLQAWMGYIDKLASGGTEKFVMATDGHLSRLHTYSTVGANQIFVNASGAALPVSYLVGGGGGAGGSGNYRSGGGGGGGQVLTGSVNLDAGTSAVTVGAGGIQSTGYGAGGSGGSSLAFGVTAAGGSGGVGANGGLGGAGGAGGGGALGAAASGFSSTAGSIGGGGGGASAAAVGSAGGAGLSSNITGTNTFYGGGGGGANGNASTVSGGSGGAGSGSPTVTSSLVFAGLSVTNALASVNDTTAPAFNSASTSADGTKIYLAYNELLNTANLPDANAFAVKVGGVARTVSAVAMLGNLVELTLATSVLSSDTNITVGYTDPSTSNDVQAVQDLRGNDAATLAVSTAVTNKVTGATADTAAPSLLTAIMDNSSSVSTTTNKLTLVYNEMLNANAVPPVSAFSVSDGTNLYAVNSLTVVGGTVQLTLSGSILKGATVQVRYVDPTTGNDLLAVQDLGSTSNGNDAVSYIYSASIPVTNPSNMDGTGPALVLSGASTSADGSKIFLTYSELLDSVNPPNVSAFGVSVGGVAQTVSTMTVRGNVVELTLASPVLSNDTNITVGYTDPSMNNDASAVQDLLGNDAATHGAPVTNKVGVADTTAPVVLAALMDNSNPNSTISNKLILVYDEMLNTGSLPSANAFLVSDGTNSKTYTVDTVLVVGSTVQLTLSGSIPKGAAVSVRYTDPTTGNDLLATQDLGSSSNGNDAASIVPGTGTNLVNFNVGNGTDGLGGGGGGAWGQAGVNIGGKGGFGVVMARYDTGVTESQLLSFLQSIEDTDTSGTVHTLTESNLATYLNAIETASMASGWAWTTEKIAVVL